MQNAGFIGLAAFMALAAVGSAIGVGVAGMSAIGAWKKCYIQNKPAPFLLFAFVGAPMTQTIYGLILMNTFTEARGLIDSAIILGAGIFGGLGMGVSAWFQGMAGAAASDAFAETGKGFANYILVVGLVETVALFVMVFLMLLLGNVSPT
ncbi:MAG: V-type ATP synthase subunit K [Spirochaetales bacterium]|jgi:V/A-type H+-transporting ATPase subunit K|nr:V-type ATP synthase subunit K [Spirochaetales bacterium]